MVRFIFSCMAIAAFAFVAVPVYTGIAGKKAELDSRQVAVTQNNSETLSFDEIYAIAAENNTPSADQLNAIEAAAGNPDDIAGQLNAIEPSAGQSQDDFSGALKESQHPAF